MSDWWRRIQQLLWLPDWRPTPIVHFPWDKLLQTKVIFKEILLDSPTNQPYPIVRVPTIREWEMGNGERTRLFIAGPWTRKRNQNRSLHTNAMTKGNKFFIWEAGRADKLKCSCHVSSYVNLTLKMKQYLFWDVKEGKALSSGHQHTNHHFNNYRSFGSWGPTRICSWVYS